MRLPLVNQLADLYANLSKRDGQLESLASRVASPDLATADSMASLSRELTDAAQQMQREYGGHRDLVERLHAGARELSRLQGKLQGMAQTQATCGPSWGTALDDEILTVREALFLAARKDWPSTH